MNIIWIFLILLGTISFISYISIVFNGLIQLKNNIQKSWANIDVLLKQRYDELPNLINTVKGYMAYEKELMENITKARANFLNANSVHEKAIVNNEVSFALQRLFAVAENYPKLKANISFLKLQKRISEIENEISDRREFYNDSVNNYNIRIQSFPDLIIAKIFGFKESDRFIAKERPGIKF